MGKINIIGNANPEIGIPHQYNIFKAFELSTIQSPAFGAHQEMAHWEIFVLERGSWRKTDGNAKTGEKVEYTFNQKSLTRKGIKMIVTKGNDKAELVIKTRPAKNPKINKIELLDINEKKVTTPLSYVDTLIAKAHCTDIEGEQLNFTLWEDDALKEGHNKINEVNKINPIPQRAIVKKGIAKVSFDMARYTLASRIANMQVAKGDKNEGKAHEYYVTAEYYGKLEASNNVNLKNPEYNAHQKVETRSTPIINQPKKNVSVKPTVVPKQPNKKPVAKSPAPKKETPKYPVGNAKTKVPDKSGKIISVEVRDKNRKEIDDNPKYGESLFVLLKTKNLLNKKYKLNIWEDDTFGSNDLLYSNIHTIKTDEQWVYVSLTKQMQQKGEIGNDANNPDKGEYSFEFTAHQEIFVEIEFPGISMESSTVEVDAKEEYKVPKKSKSVAVVKGIKKEGNNKSCMCKESYADLIWGGKVSCEFRKKVIEISKDLWPKNYMIMANHLMACMAWETGESFSPSVRNPKSSATGLIQFMADTAKDLGTSTDALAEMSAVKQLDYVKKYFENIRNKDYEFVDFYLRILYPASMGKSDSHVVFSKNGEGLDRNDKNYKGRIKAYGVNSGFDTNPKYGNNDQMVTKDEIKKGIQIYIDKGKQYKVNNFICEESLTSSNVVVPNKEKGTWNVIITEHYTGGNCTHIEKTAIRKNCRKGKIEVFDNNQKLVFVINDCLLEGVKGEDRTKTGADVPYGVYQINKSTPFYSSTAKNKKSYGPNPRLVFEPIKGTGDEADRSGRSAIRIHGGRQEGYAVKTLKRTEGCIRIYDEDAKKFYKWWSEFSKNNPNVFPGKVIIKK